jgi:hypothetical protein
MVGLPVQSRYHVARERRRIRTFYLLAPKLVFHKLRSRQIDHPLGQATKNGRFASTEATLIAALGNLWLLVWCSSLH